MPRPTCSTCVFFKPGMERGQGYCHIDPPELILLAGIVQSNLPIVHIDGLCIDHTSWLEGDDEFPESFIKTFDSYK